MPHVCFFLSVICMHVLFMFHDDEVHEMDPHITFMHSTSPLPVFGFTLANNVVRLGPSFVCHAF